MEVFALILFYIFLLGIMGSVICLIISLIKKTFKFTRKQILIALSISFIGFVVSTIFYGKVQSPESKAKYEASQKAKEEEKAKKELLEKEKKAEEEKQKQIAQENNKQEENTKTEIKEDVLGKIEPKEEATKTDDRFIITSEPNTTDAVTELYYKAKEKATKATEDDLKEAIKFINDNYNNYWIDNETMHKTLYFGSLLHCAKLEEAKKNQKNVDYAIYKLGSDTEQVVKYIYRGEEKIEDSSTQTNLKQIKKSLENIPDEYKK